MKNHFRFKIAISTQRILLLVKYTNCPFTKKSIPIRIGMIVWSCKEVWGFQMVRHSNRSIKDLNHFNRSLTESYFGIGFWLKTIIGKVLLCNREHWCRLVGRSTPNILIIALFSISIQNVWLVENNARNGGNMTVGNAISQCDPIFVQHKTIRIEGLLRCIKKKQREKLKTI